MGQFSWYTQDTGRRIVNGEPFTVFMCDDKGNSFVEHCYEGYGEFGGKDYYELLAEMNGLGSDRDEGIALAFKDSPTGCNPNCLHPSISENCVYFGGKPPKPDPNQGFPSENFYDDSAAKELERYWEELGIRFSSQKP